jgi:hypothetical protein
MTRNGKIARLPAAIREELNQRLLDGEPGNQLVQWLNGLPKVQALLKAKFNANPITENNLSHWKNGGYAAWEANDRMADNVISILDGATALQGAAKDGLTERIALFMAANMAIAMLRLESMPEGIEKVKIWRELRISLLSLRKPELFAQRLVLEREMHPRPEKQKKRPEWTPEQKRQRIRQILGLGDGYDGSINPEWTRPPAMPPTIQPDSVPANIGQYRSISVNTAK